jgi:hypothetical protein
VENPNDMLMNETIQRFQAHNVEFEQTVSVGYNMAMSAVSDELQRKKEINRHRKQHEKDFKEAYDMINLNQWYRKSHYPCITFHETIFFAIGNKIRQ